MELRELDKGLWVAEASMRTLGLDLRRRMTILRLGDGGLLLHSPVPLAGRLREQIAGLGSVRGVLMPNLMHHLAAQEAIEAFPRATTYAPPGLAKKRPDLRIDRELDEEAPAEWGGALEVCAVRGTRLEERVLFQPSTSTLVLTDLAFRLPAGEGGAWRRLYLRLNGARGELTVMRLMRMMIRDRAAARAALDRILEWPVERVVVGHGTVCERGGREELQRAFADL